MNEEAKNLLAQARVHSDFGRATEAIALLRRALALAPDNSTLHCQLAAIHFKQEQWDKMLECAEKAVAASPDAEWPHRVHSIALLNLNRREEALAAAHQAARIAPDAPAVLVNLSNTLNICCNYKEAEAVGLRAAQVSPEDVRAHVALANIYTNISRWPDVEKYARLGLTTDAGRAVLHRILGRALTAQGKSVEAVQAYASALNLEPVHEETRQAFRKECVLLGINSFPCEIIFIGAFILIFLLDQRYRSLWTIAGMTVLVAALPLTALALAMRFKPALLLSLQRGYRSLPVNTRRLVAQQCTTDWVQFGSGLFAVVIACLLAFVSSVMKARFYAR